ncbi:hypothetical protein [Nocardia sp. NPDC055049]
MSIDSGKPERVRDPLDIHAGSASAIDPASDSQKMAALEHAPPPSDAHRHHSLPDRGAGLTDSGHMLRTEAQQPPAPSVPNVGRVDRALGGPVDESARGQDFEPATDGDTSKVGTELVGAADDPGLEHAPRQHDVDTEQIILKICHKRGVDGGEGIEAVRRAYDVVKDDIAPFLVKHMTDMLDHCRAEVAADPDHRYGFLGRDGYPLATIVGTLDPDFFVKHCALVPVTRRMIEPALRDDEENAGKAFHIDAFRKYKDEVMVDAIDGAKASLTERLEYSGLPVGEEGARITVIDTSRKGSTQEGLTALYPHNDWYGRYLCLERSPHDPNPGSKTGYALDSDAPHTAIEGIPEDREETFAHPDAILAIEDLLHGPWSSPVDADSAQELQAPPVDEINPLDISPPFQDPAIRLAAAEVMVIAVRDRAIESAQLRDQGGDWRTPLDEQATQFVDKLRSWIARRGTDPGTAEILGSFARRIDRPHVAALRTAIVGADLDPADAQIVWQGYQQAVSLDEKRVYVANFEQARTPTTGVGSEREP